MFFKNTYLSCVTITGILYALGLLTMVLDAFHSGQVPDITIIPVNISYDRTLEEVLFAYELLGIAKPKESTSVSKYVT